MKALVIGNRDRYEKYMPDLKIIHSEGVGYNGFDIQTAQEKGVYVCNCRGVNAGAVAEQTVLLILAVLRNLVVGDRIEREGHQMEMKEERWLAVCWKYLIARLD